MTEHILSGPPGRQICLRCGWAEWDEDEPCRRPRVEPGMRFARLTVVEQRGVQKFNRGRDKWVVGSRLWWCRCDCGVYKLLPTDRLTTGHTRSCGCLRREVKHRPAKGKFGSQYDRRQRKAKRKRL